MSDSILATIWIARRRTFNYTVYAELLLGQFYKYAEAVLQGSLGLKAGGPKADGCPWLRYV